MNRIIDYIQTVKKDRGSKPFCAYLYDMSALRDHVTRRVKTLPSQCRLFYAIKANSEAAILQALAPIVHGFEVASLGEVKKVRAISADIPIIFGGPGKTDEELEGAIEQRVSLIHVESLHEIRRIILLAQKHDVVVPILLRVNLRGPLPQATLAMGGRPTQFGIDEELVPEAIELAKQSHHLRLEGFHFHSLSNNLDAAEHVRLVEYYCQLVSKWARKYRLSIRFLNVGGGIGVNYADLDRQFDWDHFIDGLSAILEQDGLPGTTIYFECGRYLTAAAGYYAAEVLDIKQNHGKTFVIVRGGTHHFRLPASWQHSHPFQVVPIEQWPYTFERECVQKCKISVVGQLCTPKDVMAKEVEVAQVRIGDVILFRYAGAYGWAISHHDFLSHPHPEHVYFE